MFKQLVYYLQESLKKKDSAVSELFKKSLVNNRVEFVTLVLKYILAPECYQQFVTDNLSLLYREVCSELVNFILNLPPESLKDNSWWISFNPNLDRNPSFNGIQIQ